MFCINFRIVDDIQYLKSIDEIEFDSKVNDIEGYFSTNFNGNIEGFYHNNKLNKSEVGDELLTVSFELLIKVIFALKKQSSYILLKEIECIDSWLEFVLVGNSLKVSYVKYIGKQPNSAIIISDKNSIIYPSWKDITIEFNQFKNEVILKANDYISQISKINPRLISSKRIKSLVSDLESIQNI